MVLTSSAKRSERAGEPVETCSSEYRCDYPINKSASRICPDAHPKPLVFRVSTLVGTSGSRGVTSKTAEWKTGRDPPILLRAIIPRRCKRLIRPEQIACRKTPRFGLMCPADQRRCRGRSSLAIESLNGGGQQDRAGRRVMSNFHGHENNT